MKTTEESVVTAMDGTDPDIFSFLPYILQDFWEIGTSPGEVTALLEKRNPDHRTEVLDLGCGKGVVSIKLAETFGCRCLGIDAIKEFIGDANNKAEETGVDSLCTFRVADIREEIRNTGLYDVIVLGAIGRVFGGYDETLATILPHLKNRGVVIIDDAYIEAPDGISHPSVLGKAELLRQVDSAGMKISAEIRAQEDISEDHEKEFQLLTGRCYELISQYPEKASLFQDYINNQQKEYTTMENDMVCAVMLLERK